MIKSLFGKSTIFLFVLTLALGSARAVADDYRCEVMGLKGTVFLINDPANPKPLKQGDMLKVDDTIQVSAASYVDLAFDSQWNNVSRIDEKTKVTIRSVFPTGLKMEEGDIFTRLNKLPQGSTFEIQTPSAVAAVRGTVYWTEHRDGETRVFNYSPSPVEVFNLDDKGNIQDRVVVEEHQKTEVTGLNEAPKPPEKMTDAEMNRAGNFRSGIEDAVKLVVTEGRTGQAPTIADMENKMREHLAETAAGGQNPPVSDDNGSVSGPNGPGGPGSGGDPTAGSSGPGTGPNTFMPPPDQPPAGMMPPPLPDTMTNTMQNIQNSVDGAVRTVDQTVATNEFRSTTVLNPPLPPNYQPPCGSTTGTTSGGTNYPPPPPC